MLAKDRKKIHQSNTIGYLESRNKIFHKQYNVAHPPQKFEQLQQYSSNHSYSSCQPRSSSAKANTLQNLFTVESNIPSSQVQEKSVKTKTSSAYVPQSPTKFNMLSSRNPTVYPAVSPPYRSAEQNAEFASANTSNDEDIPDRTTSRKKNTRHEPPIYSNPTSVTSTHPQRTHANHSAYSQDQDLIKHLCETEGGTSILLDRVKTGIQSCKDISTFLKKRAALEEEYGRGMLKLVNNIRENAQKEGKRGSFGIAWNEILTAHEKVAENKLQFASNITEIGEEVATLYKDTERSRKQLRDTGIRYEKIMQEAEINLEKAKTRYETQSEDWERAILQKENVYREHSHGINKRRTALSMFKQNRSPTKIEEEARMKAAVSNESYQQQLGITNSQRREYYTMQLPRVLGSLKETNDECDTALQYHLGKYAFHYENMIMADAVNISPLKENEKSVRQYVDEIDNRQDLLEFIETASATLQKGHRGDIPYYGYSMGTLAPQGSFEYGHCFGTTLAEQCHNEQRDIPLIIEKCTMFIEEVGIHTVGIYRLSGISSRVQKLRNQFDKDASKVDLMSEEWGLSSVNEVAGVLKLYFRELKDPLFPREYYEDFMKASRIDDDRLRILNLHDLVNRLPDPNYHTLRYLMCHLDRVQREHSVNKMGISNLGIVFGPTLFGGGMMDDKEVLQDMTFQCRAVETILASFSIIFEDE